MTSVPSALSVNQSAKASQVTGMAYYLLPMGNGCQNLDSSHSLATSFGNRSESVRPPGLDRSQNIPLDINYLIKGNKTLSAKTR
jgi:hypothetical protein